MHHGTMVAGIIAAVANNETGIVGAAQDAELVSTRVKWAWGHMTQALGLQWQFDISNNSWGAIAPFSDNFNSTQHTFSIGLTSVKGLSRDEMEKAPCLSSLQVMLQVQAIIPIIIISKMLVK